MGMTSCMQCGGTTVGTIDSRHHHNIPWRVRRKHCSTCGHRWTTYEVPAETLDGIVELHQQIKQVKVAISKVEALFTAMPISETEQVQPLDIAVE